MNAASPRPRAEDVAGRERRAQDAEHGRGVVVGGRMHHDLAGEHDLLERAGADLLDGARDRGFVVLGRGDRGDAEAPGGSGVDQRQPGVAQLARPRFEPRRELVGHVVGGGEDSEREPHVAAAAGERHLRDDQIGRLEARPVRRVAAVVGEREAADRHQAGAGGPVRRVGLGRSGQLPPRGGRLLEAPRPAALDPADAAERGERGAAAVGLLEAEPGLAGTARGEGDGARVDVRRERERDPGEHLAPAAASAPHGALAALSQPVERDGGSGDARHSTAAKVWRPVAQRSITRPLGERSTEETESVPLTPVVVKRPSTRTR